MRLLLDTHAFLWFYMGSPELSPVVRDAILDRKNDVYVSIATIWEIALLTGKKRLTWDLPFEQEVVLMLDGSGATLLLIHLDHVQRVNQLPAIHKDPFDRMIVAQAMSEDLVIATCDAKVQQYEIPSLW